MWCTRCTQVTRTKLAACRSRRDPLSAASYIFLVHLHSPPPSDWSRKPRDLRSTKATSLMCAVRNKAPSLASYSLLASLRCVVAQKARTAISPRAPGAARMTPFREKNRGKLCLDPVLSLSLFLFLFSYRDPLIEDLFFTCFHGFDHDLGFFFPPYFWVIFYYLWSNVCYKMLFLLRCKFCP